MNKVGRSKVIIYAFSWADISISRTDVEPILADM